MICRYHDKTYEAHKFPRVGDSKMTGGNGTVETFHCNNCSLAMMIVFVTISFGVETYSEFIVEPRYAPSTGGNQ